MGERLSQKPIMSLILSSKSAVINATENEASLQQSAAAQIMDFHMLSGGNTDHEHQHVPKHRLLTPNWSLVALGSLNISLCPLLCRSAFTVRAVAIETRPKNAMGTMEFQEAKAKRVY